MEETGLSNAKRSRAEPSFPKLEEELIGRERKGEGMAFFFQDELQFCFLEGLATINPQL